MRASNVVGIGAVSEHEGKQCSSKRSGTCKLKRRDERADSRGICVLGGVGWVGGSRKQSVIGSPAFTARPLAAAKPSRKQRVIGFPPLLLDPEALIQSPSPERPPGSSV